MSTATFKPVVRAVSDEIFNPPFHCQSRRTSLLPATFNILCTIMGGSILTLPYVLSKAGVLVGILLLLFSATVNSFSLYIICSCSRRTGSDSLAEIANYCLGKRAKIAMSVIILLLTFLTAIAYLILLRDIGSSLVAWAVGEVLSTTVRTIVLGIVVVLIFPLTLLESLHGLRHANYIAAASVFFLALILTYKTIMYNLIDHPIEESATRYTASNINWIHGTLSDTIFCFPITGLAYICQFNMLSVHSQLIGPSRIRVKKVILYAIASATVLYLLASLAGFTYALADTKDDIFNNFRANDVAVVLARMGMAFTVACGFPMFILPCRCSLYEVVSAIKAAFNSSDKETTSNNINAQGRGQYAEVSFSENTYGATSSDIERSSAEQNGDQQENGRDTTNDDFDFSGLPPPPSSPLPSPPPSRVLLPSSLAPQSQPQSQPSQPLPHFSAPPAWSRADYILHVIVTVVLVGGTYGVACLVESISVIWSLIGSSVGFSISFVLPGLLYLKVRAHKGTYNWRARAAYAIIGIGLVAMVVCTSQSVARLFRSPSSEASGNGAATEAAVGGDDSR